MESKLENLIKKNITTLFHLLFAIIIYLLLMITMNLELRCSPLSISILLIIYFMIETYDKQEIKSNITVPNIAGSIFFGIMFVLGHDYLWNNEFLTNINLLGSIIMLLKFIISSFLFYNFLTIINRKKIFKNKKEKNINFFMKQLNKTNIFSIFLLITVCWIPYMILMYPTYLNPDSMFELAEFLGIDNAQSHDVILKNTSQLITSHHPVLYTYIIGIFSKIGNINFGLYLFNILQTLFIIFCISKLLLFVNHRINDNRILSYFLICICFFPFIPYTFTSLEKDILFTCFFILFIMEIYKLIFENTTNILTLIISSIGIILLRNNVKYIFFLFLILLFWKLKDKRKIIILTCICSIAVIIGLIIFCNINDITKGSKAEMLSIPFQQTARYVTYYENEVTKEEKEVIDKVLIYDKLKKNYNPRVSDTIKNTFNDRKPTEQELNNYFKIWFRMFLKHPMCYVEATINNQIENFYIGSINVYTFRRSYDTKRYVMSGDYIDYYKLDTSKFGFKPISQLEPIEKFMDNFIYRILNTPIIGYFALSAIYIWFTIILIIQGFNKKNSKLLLFCSFFVLYLGTFILGPCDSICEFRYVYPFYVSSPLFYLLFSKYKQMDDT